MHSIDALKVAASEAAAESFDGLSCSEKLLTLAKLEEVQRQLLSVSHTLTAGIVAQGSPIELGGTSFPDVLSRKLHISKSVARRRIGDSEQLGPRQALNGEPLAPMLPSVADALRRGEVGEEHVRIVRGFFDKLASAVDAPTREAAERQLAQMAVQFGPDQLRMGADRIMVLLNPDGEFSDVDRARRRGMTIGRQGFDGMSPITGLLDPETRSYLDALLSKLAAPGMCNPTDESPIVDGEPAREAADHRTDAQRNHDALRAVCRSTLASGQLGSHHGLPVTVVVSTTLDELESASGQAVTGGGTLLPMRDVIRMASHALHYLTIFDDDGRPLYLGRTKRIASVDQRIVLHANDRGCTHPGCSVPGYLCEVHHVDDWADGGATDIERLTFVCGPHHRLLAQGWTTRKNRKTGRTEWIPPPQLGLNEGFTNEFHHPELLTLQPD
ncbi:HNH endonuclease signature motif containing protein [Mycobacteroides sp. LB1]|uniref:HNH endonuclease signature motif containing protein n=1 Tax=Mycobacteroides sp. LB1 TaxID=2750814 RepID=UPI0015DF6CF8|nr:HNH endonuclease [Mycobacteroides sp. LB1]